MKILKENKLLISLFLGIFLLIVVLAVFTTAKYVPGMSKYTERAYYDIPKAPLPEQTVTGQGNLGEDAQPGFTDPIVRERLQEERNGVPLPTDILPGPGPSEGLDAIKFPGVANPVLEGYGPLPESVYDELYKDNSPFKLLGPPGRLGKMLKEYKEEAKKEKNEVKKEEIVVVTDSDPSVVPDGSVLIKEQDPSKIANALAKLIRTLEAARKASEEKKPKPVEGKPDEEEKSG